MRTRSTIACEKLEYCTVFFEVLWGSRSGRGHALLQRGEGTFFECATQDGGAEAGGNDFCCTVDGWNYFRRQATAGRRAWTLSEIDRAFAVSRVSSSSSWHVKMKTNSTLSPRQRTNRSSSAIATRQWAATCRNMLINVFLVTQDGCPKRLFAGFMHFR